MCQWLPLAVHASTWYLVLVLVLVTLVHGWRNRWVWGTMSPHFWDQRSGVRWDGPMKMIFASTAESFISPICREVPLELSFTKFGL